MLRRVFSFCKLVFLAVIACSLLSTAGLAQNNVDFVLIGLLFFGSALLTLNSLVFEAIVHVQGVLELVIEDLSYSKKGHEVHQRKISPAKVAHGSQVDRFLQELTVSRYTVLTPVSNLVSGVREAYDVIDLVQVVGLPIKVYLVPARAGGHKPS